MNRPMTHQGHRAGARRALLIVVVSVLALAAAACAAGSGDLGGVATPPPTAGSSSDIPTLPPPTGGTTSAPSATTEPSTAPIGTTVVRAYFFLGSFTNNAGLAPVEREIPKTQAVGAASIAALLAGPNAQEMGTRPAMYTSIPQGTRFLGLQISDGIATVNLSSEFQAGGDALSVKQRVAQVVYTLTQFPTVRGVRFEFDGVPPKTVFIGSFERADYTDMLPAIFVDGPVWGGQLGNPARVMGISNVFEATFRIAILNSSGTVLVDTQAMASCGSGCWGTFDVTIPYSVSSAQAGTLQVYDLSARDGSREHLTEYPVRLVP
jgi:germination protein M